MWAMHVFVSFFFQPQETQLKTTSASWLYIDLNPIRRHILTYSQRVDSISYVKKLYHALLV